MKLILLIAFVILFSSCEKENIEPETKSAPPAHAWELVKEGKIGLSTQSGK